MAKTVVIFSFFGYRASDIVDFSGSITCTHSLIDMSLLVSIYFIAFRKVYFSILL